MEKSSNISKVRAKVGNLVRNLRRDGLLGSMELYRIRTHEMLRDWRLGIRTMGFVDASELAGC